MADAPFWVDFGGWLGRVLHVRTNSCSGGYIPPTTVALLRTLFRVNDGWDRNRPHRWTPFDGDWLAFGKCFIFAALSCLAGAAIYTALDGILRRSGGAIKGNKLGFAAAMSILRSKAAFPIVMVGLGGAVFGGLSSFQISYAAERQLDYSLFFSGFVAAVIVGRLFLSGAALRCEPHITSLVLTCCVVAAIVLLMMIETHPIAYVAAAALLGGGYGLTYSVINGLVANEAPSGLVPQALLLFSLSYFVGVFGFPLIAGALIAEQGIRPMMIVTLVIASINATIPLVRVFSR